MENTFTSEEKIQLGKDLELLSNVVQAHDQTIFQIIASINATQALMMQKELCTQKELIEQTQLELEKIQNNFLRELEKKASVENTEE